MTSRANRDYKIGGNLAWVAGYWRRGAKRPRSSYEEGGKKCRRREGVVKTGVGGGVPFGGTSGPKRTTKMGNAGALVQRKARIIFAGVIKEMEQVLR